MFCKIKLCTINLFGDKKTQSTLQSFVYHIWRQKACFSGCSSMRKVHTTMLQMFHVESTMNIDFLQHLNGRL